MTVRKRRLSFQTIILALCLSIIACTLAVSMILLSKVYSIAGNMQASISTYQTIDQLSRNIKDADSTYQSFFSGLTGQESDEERKKGKEDILDYIYRAKAEAKKLTVTYAQDKERYFLVRAIRSGLDYMENYVSSMFSQSFPLKQEAEFSAYYWGIKVFSYLDGYCYNQLLNQAVSADSVTSITNQETMRNLRTIVLLVLFIVCITAILASIGITRRLTDPLRNMVDTAGEITKGNLDTPDLVPDGPQELVFLETSMNTMKQSLKERMALEQQLYEHTLEQEKMNRELERAQFLSLQSQINPHFLFNTLNTISHTALFEKADDTVALINALAGFLRYTLEYKDSVWLETEFEFVRQYLSLQQARFKDRLGYSLNLDPSLRNLEVPPLFLQPLVENAVKHGLEPLSEGGFVTVVAKPERGNALIVVEDSGVGIKEDFSVDALRSDGKHIGIVNVRDRLSMFTGGKATFTMERISEDGGTRVTITLPGESL
ncbi:MAG: histidine kinase [Sphaerochaetaceae bacterium]